MQRGPRLSSDEVDLFTSHHRLRFASFMFLFSYKCCLVPPCEVCLMHRRMKYSFQVAAASSASLCSTETQEKKTITPKFYMRTVNRLYYEFCVSVYCTGGSGEGRGRRTTSAPASYTAPPLHSRDLSSQLILFETRNLPSLKVSCCGQLEVVMTE